MELLDQPTDTRPPQLITQNESHIKKPWDMITNQLEKHMLKKRNDNQQSTESGLARMNEKDVMLTRTKIKI